MIEHVACKKAIRFNNTFLRLVKNIFQNKSTAKISILKIA